MEEIQGGVQSDAGAGSSQQQLFIQGTYKCFTGKVLNAYLQGPGLKSLYLVHN